MNRAGDYTTKLRWYVCVQTLNEMNGQLENVYHANGYLRCGVDENSGRRSEDDGAIQTGASSEIRIRQYPAFAALDLLHDETFGFVWRTESIHYGDNEVICDSYRLDADSLNNYQIDDSE